MGSCCGRLTDLGSASDEERLKRDLEELVRLVERNGGEAKVIETKDIVVDERARLKCMYPPCHWYGSSIMCPPHLELVPSTTERIVKKYRYGILIRLETPVEDLAGPEWTKRHVPHELKLREVVGLVECEANNMGYYFALGFAAGECSLCLSKNLECEALKTGRCRYPFKARPAMEAAGIDVFATVKKAGWEIHTITPTKNVALIPCAALYGLVLIH
ncbi:MAG: DUF2284 domain-containing protein [Candidatus Verstraetearchaeota archaeon]|nr:DUF2284 domain-containing protein [Candidatus Verstraetearchaeota archaeon]